MWVFRTAGVTMVTAKGTQIYFDMVVNNIVRCINDDHRISEISYYYERTAKL